ncbi:MAG: ABC transporter permease [Acidobacteriaceae bacterium]|nr:ABC transporter permease [Acidobacteriaceae bacterium]
MGNAFEGFWAVLVKESLHLSRDSVALVLALGVPLIQMSILGWAIDTNVRQVSTVVLNEDGRRQSRELIQRFENSDTFRVVSYATNDAELHDAVRSGRARVAIKIPVDFADRLSKDRTATVLILIDGSDSSVAGQAITVSTAIGLDESLRRVLGPRQVLPVEIRPQLLFNPDSRSPNFFLPGLLAVLLLSVTTFLTAFSIVREKENGTLEQLFITPVRPLGLLLGKIVPYLALGFVELCALLIAMRWVFGVPIHGSTVLLLVLSIPYLFVAIAFGTFISTRVSSQAQAMQMAFLTFIPSIFFSGYIFPRDTMPAFCYWLSYLVPATYYINITRGIILRGAAFQHVAVDGAILVSMGLGLLLLAARQFQRKVIA